MRVNIKLFIPDVCSRNFRGVCLKQHAANSLVANGAAQLPQGHAAVFRSVQREGCIMLHIILQYVQLVVSTSGETYAAMSWELS